MASSLLSGISIPSRNGKTSREVSSARVSLFREWDAIPSMQRRDMVNKAMKEDGLPCLISYALDETGQFKPISYRMNDAERKSVLVDGWPETVEDVISLNAFLGGATTKEEKAKRLVEIRGMRLKMGSVVLSGEDVFDILRGEKEDIRVSMGEKAYQAIEVSPARNSTLATPHWAETTTMDEEEQLAEMMNSGKIPIRNGKSSPAPVAPGEDDDEGTEEAYVKPTRKPGEGFGEYMKRCKAAKANAASVKAGEKPNGGSIVDMASRGSSLTAAIEKAGGKVPSVGEKGKKETPRTHSPSRAELVAMLLQDEGGFTDTQVEIIEGIVKREIARAMARFLSLFPADYLPHADDEE